MRRRSRTPWFQDGRARLRFEGRARQRYPKLQPEKRGRGLGAEIIYRLRLNVPYYEARSAEIRFENGYIPGEPRVTVDGPKESPHRYRGGYLCIWEPTDEDGQRWVSSDGLDQLIEQIRRHLFREAWWREHGEWLGPEVVHWGEKEAA